MEKTQYKTTLSYKDTKEWFTSVISPSKQYVIDSAKEILEHNNNQFERKLVIDSKPYKIIL